MKGKPEKKGEPKRNGGKTKKKRRGREGKKSK